MMLDKFSLKIVSWLAAVMCVAAASAQGQSTAQIGFEGNWSVEWADVVYGDTPSSAKISLFQNLKEECWDGPREVRMQGCAFEKTIEPGAEWNLGIDFPGDQWDRVQAVTIDPDSGVIAIHHYYNMFEYWGGNEEARLVTPDRIEGVWSTGDTQGRTFWQRIIPDITHVELFDGDQRGNFLSFEILGPNHISVRANWDAEYWGDSSFPHSRPVFGVRVFGDNFWGRHVAAIPNSIGFQVEGVSLEANAGNADYLTFLVRLWPGVQPGQHVLLLDGQEILIDLAIKNFPAKLTNIAVEPLAFTGLGTPNSLSVDKLAFHGLAGSNGTEVRALTFTGLGVPKGQVVERLVFTGLNGRNGAEVGPLKFTGMGELEPVTVSDELVFEGWGGGLEMQTTDEVSFTGWGGGLEGQTTEQISFEGWGGGPESVSVDPLEFRGLGPGLLYVPSRMIK